MIHVCLGVFLCFIDCMCFSVYKSLLSWKPNFIEIIFIFWNVFSSFLLCYWFLAALIPCKTSAASAATGPWLDARNWIITVQPGRNLRKGIKDAKVDYKQRIEDHFGSSDPPWAWQGIHHMTGQNSTSLQISSSSTRVVQSVLQQLWGEKDSNVHRTINSQSLVIQSAHSLKSIMESSWSRWCHRRIL